MKTVTRVYDSYSQARAAVDAVEKSGVPSSDVSIVANKYVSAEHADVDDVSDAAKGAGIGGALGAAPGCWRASACSLSRASAPLWPRAGWQRLPSAPPLGPRPAAS